MYCIKCPYLCDVFIKQNYLKNFCACIVCSVICYSLLYYIIYVDIIAITMESMPNLSHSLYFSALSFQINVF
jgi:hypothetical protein